MIKTWKHKGLRLFYESGSKKGIQAKHAGFSRSYVEFRLLALMTRPKPRAVESILPVLQKVTK